MPYTPDHVGITVADIETSAEFYHRLGFGPYPPNINVADKEWIKVMTGFDDAHLRITQMSLGKVRLELLQYVTPEGEKQVTTRTCDAGNAHMGINVDDLAWEYERLTEMGVEFRSAPIVVSDGADAGVKAVYLSDPDGNTVELVEWSPEKRAERDA